MPYGLFDYGGTINTMGLSPVPPGSVESDVLCKNGTYDPVNGLYAPCRYKGGVATPVKYRPRNPPPPKCAPTLKTGNCLYKLA